MDPVTNMNGEIVCSYDEKTTEKKEPGPDLVFRVMELTRAATPEQIGTFKEMDSGDQHLFLSMPILKDMTQENIDLAYELTINNVEGDLSQLPESVIDYGKKKGWIKDPEPEPIEEKIEPKPEPVKEYEPDPINCISSYSDGLDLKAEAKTLSALDDVLGVDEAGPDQQPLDIGRGVMDVSQILEVIAKTNKAQALLNRFYNNNCKPPKIAYKPGPGVYDIEQFMAILKVLKASGKHVSITNGRDRPIILENEHFRFYLAPRIETN